MKKIGWVIWTVDWPDLYPKRQWEITWGPKFPYRKFRFHLS